MLPCIELQTSLLTATAVEAAPRPDRITILVVVDARPKHHHKSTTKVVSSRCASAAHTGTKKQKHTQTVRDTVFDLDCTYFSEAF